MVRYYYFWHKNSRRIITTRTRHTTVISKIDHLGPHFNNFWNHARNHKYAPHSRQTPEIAKLSGIMFQRGSGGRPGSRNMPPGPPEPRNGQKKDPMCPGPPEPRRCSPKKRKRWYTNGMLYYAMVCSIEIYHHSQQSLEITQNHMIWNTQDPGADCI